MAVYKIFPTQDTTIYSSTYNLNAGLDEMLEVGAYNNKSGVSAPNLVLADLSTDDIRRTLLQFSTSEMKAVIDLAGNTPVTSSLRMFVAEADNLTETYRIEAYPLNKSWANGTGKAFDTPATTNGASWLFRSAESYNVKWNPPTGTYFINTGGGTWNANTSSYGTQSFDFHDTKDINMDITSMVNSWRGVGSSGSLINYGIIVKFPTTGSTDRGDVFENNPKSFIGLKFYSRDTHTIYPPCLEMKWSDYSFNTGSTAYTTASTDTFVMVSTNNAGEYKQDSVYTFKFKAREQYPTRVFSTSSVYLNWQYLPPQSYWAIQDYKTKEMIVDFDTVATKLSVDPTGNYFKVYMNGLEPERSYKILIKSTLQTGETVVKDQDIIFKVIR